MIAGRISAQIEAMVARPRGLGLGAVLALGAASFAPSSALADEDEAPRKKRRMIVTVEDNDKVDDEEVGEPSEEEAAPAERRAPRVGDSPDEIREYLAGLEDRVRRLKAKLKAAKRGDDADRLLEVEADLAEAKARLDAERERLTERNAGMIAGGATLIGLGSISFVASVVLVIGWGVSAVDGYPDDEWGWGSLGCLAGGVVGIAVGVPVLVGGLKREPREVEDAMVLPPTRTGFTPGLSLTFPLSF